MPFRTEDHGGKVKPVGHVMPYTAEQKYELMIRCPEDPIYFITTYCWIISTKGGQMLFDLYEYQKRLVLHYLSHEKTITLLSRQVGKALDVDTPIPTPKGFKRMGDLRAGDLVIGDDGKPTKILYATGPMLNHKCYRVRFDTDEIIADAEHLWEVGSSIFDHERRKLTTEELISVLDEAHASKQAVYVPVSEPFEYEERKVPIDPYLLGVWLGDGNSRHCAIYGTHNDLSEIISYISKKGYEAKPLVKDKRNEVYYCKVLDVYPHLKTLNLHCNKHIPDDYLYGSIEQRLELLRGLMDTDGYCREDGMCQFYQKSSEFCDSFRLLLSSLGIKSRKREKLVNGETYHTVQFTTNRFEVFKLQRKLNRQKACKGHPKNKRHYIQSIEEVDSVPVRCIRVSNDSHLFLCGTSCIPTHNTETTVAFLLWWAIFKPHQTILIASYKADFAKAIMSRLKFMYEELPWWLKPGVKSWNVMSVEFENGSKIIAETTTENTGRGYPVNLFYFDEFAYVPPNISEGLWTSIFPTITSSPDCRCIITSTANTDEDKFAQIWFNSRQSRFSGDTSYTKRMVEDEADGPDYDTFWEDDEIKKEIQEQSRDEDAVHGFWGFHVSWDTVPGRDAEFKQSVLASGYSEEQWGRDYECKFLTDNPTLISATKLLALNSVVKPPRFVDRWGMRWYEEVKPSTNYGVMLDPSEGVGRDDACVQVVELPSNDSSPGFVQIAEWNTNLADQAEQSKMLYRTIRRIWKIQQNDPDHNGRSQIFYSVECNGIGLGILNALEIEYEVRIPGALIDSRDNKMRGIRMTPANKKNRCLDMAALIERNVLVPRSRQLVSQLKTFVQRRAGVYAAKDGAKDDIVMAMVLMVQLIEELRIQDYDIQDRLLFEVTDNYDTSDAESAYGGSYKPFCIIG